MRVLLVLLLVGTALGDVALAQDAQNAQEETGDVRAAARAFEEGQRAQLEGDYTRAAQLFELAHRSAPAAPALRAAIRNHRAAGARARAATLSLMAMVTYAADSDTRTLAQEVLAENESTLARLRVSCSEPCELQVDDRVASLEPAAQFELFVDPGPRRIRANFEADRHVDQEVDATAGESRDVLLEAPPIAEPIEPIEPIVEQPDPDPAVITPAQPDPARGYRREPMQLDRPSRRGWSPVGTWVSLAVTAGLGAILVWSLVDAFDTSDRYKANPTRELYEEGQDTVRRTWGLGIATGVAATGTLLIALLGTDWYGSDEHAHSALRPQLQLAPNSAFAGIDGRF